ncbi:hypothetical protein GGI19_005500 [Coemansia pectinata]|uniref:Zinc finger PHD-type domain-containing protein n=1 Tax=Coemansia pectinata TaxID=1052879 RepID=A0A9W8GS68_9FUNG|nr:hypothetical protein GGI19_005500 [Coemansia pectinata]
MPFATRNGQQRPGALNDTRNFAHLSQFIYLFREALKVDDFNVEQLEYELSLTDQDDNRGQPLLRQIIKRVLRTLTGNRSIDENRLDVYIARAWQKYMEGTGEELPAAFETLGLLGLGAGDRTRVVLETCEMLMCRPDNLRAIASVASTDPLEYRVEPVGTDDMRRKYWLLCGTRLYRETPKAMADLLLAVEDEVEKVEDVEEKSQDMDVCTQPEKEEEMELSQSNSMGLRRRSTRIVAQQSKPVAVAASPPPKSKSKLPSKEVVELADPPRHRMREQDGDLWELLCTTAKEWTDIPNHFCRSKSKAERSLFKALEDASSHIVHELSVAARQRHMQEALTVRKRSSRIAMLESKHEFDMRQLAEAEALAAYSDDYGSRRQSKRLRGRMDTGGISSDDSHSLPSACTRDIRAQRREQARLAALDHEEAEQAIRNVDEFEQPPTSAETLARSSPEANAPDEVSGGGVQMEDEDWMFNCSCGKIGLNYDDGRAMTACEKCAVWRHLGCALRAEAQRIGRTIEEDDWDSVYYICPECRAKQQQETSAQRE